MKVALAQINPIVGDIAGNLEKAKRFCAQAARAGAQLVVFPELSICGYPPRDLLAKERFVADSVAAVEQLADSCRSVAALVGFVRPAPGAEGQPLQNAAALLADGQIRDVHIKRLLPTYDVFDETRYFQPGGDSGCVEVAGIRVGVSICEDLWDAEGIGRQLYDADPIGQLSAAGAEIIVNMAASPYQTHKPAKRREVFSRQAQRAGAPILYCNQVGGNDELIFDGASCCICASGRVVAQAASFCEDLLVVDVCPCGTGTCSPLPGDIESLAEAIRLGLGDYVRKCGFSKVVLGLSGGIDSALVAALAADALGGENVLGLAMPSRYSSGHSVSDARQLAENLGIDDREIAIEPMHRAFEQASAELLAEGDADLAGENIQARIRGVLVMAASNALGHLALATGNKSELSVGYCTLYGDMCGGLAPIGDVYKTDVYRLCEWLNDSAGHERIPRHIIEKPPSAELKPGQVDQDKLPPYDQLDAILLRYVERDLTGEQIVGEGYDADTVWRVIGMVDAAEFKRKQAAPVLKVTARAFGAGRRVPIAQRYRPLGGRR